MPVHGDPLAGLVAANAPEAKARAKNCSKFENSHTFNIRILLILFLIISPSYCVAFSKFRLQVPVRCDSFHEQTTALLPLLSERAAACFAGDPRGNWPI